MTITVTQFTMHPVVITINPLLYKRTKFFVSQFGLCSQQMTVIQKFKNDLLTLKLTDLKFSKFIC